MIPRRLPQRDLAACSIAVIALPGHAGERVELLGWTVCTKRVRTSKGDCMKFITMEDTTDLFEVVLFPCAYRRCGHLLNTPGPFAVRGKAENDSGEIVIKVDRLRPLLEQPRTIETGYAEDGALTRRAPACRQAGVVPF